MAPWAPARPCQHPGCPARVVAGTSRCVRHQKDRWSGRASSNERGYGHAWRKAREVVLNQASHLCAQCGKPIARPDWVESSPGRTSFLWFCRACDYRFEAIAIYEEAHPDALAA